MSFIRLLLQGSLPGGEKWSVNPCFGETLNVADWDQSKGDATATAIGLLPLGTAMGKAKGDAAALVKVRLERRTDSNVLIGAAEANWAPSSGGSTASIHPYQTSVVLSLRSTTPGRSGRGRLYWPATGATLSGSTLRLSSPTTAELAAGAGTYLKAIQTALHDGLDPSPSFGLYHELNVFSPTHNTRAKVSRLEVGDVLDVQRRRRDSLVENRASVAY